jgi:hypothetical protein
MWIMAALHRLPIGGEECPEVLVQFARDHELVEFLPDR